MRWQAPDAVTARARTSGGLELLRAIASGELPSPPVAELLGMRIVLVEPSRAVFELDPAEFLYSPLGTVHGGILTTVLDSAMGCSLHTTLPAGISYTTLELKVNFVRPVTEATGPIRADARLVHRGGTVATAEARLLDRSDVLYAHATSTLLVLQPKVR